MPPIRTHRMFILVLLPMLLYFACRAPFFAHAEAAVEKLIPGEGLAESAPPCVLGDRCYYSAAEGVMSCALDGSDPRLVFPGPGTVFTDGESLYRGTQSEITRLTAEGEEELLLRVYPLVNEGAFAIMNTMSHFAAREGSVYYVLTMAQDYELWKLSADGSTARLCSLCPPECTVLDLFFWEGAEGIFVRYQAEEDPGWTLLRVLDAAA